MTSMLHAGGPALPTEQAVRTLRPLGTHLESTCVLGRWRHRTVGRTIPHCIDQLERAGTLTNLRRVLGRPGDWTPPRFSDSDVYKTLEACAWSGQYLDFVDETATLLSEVQDADGYLNSWTQGGQAERFVDFSHGHEMYCAGHLIQAAVADARQRSDSPLLEVATRLADLLVRSFGASGKPAVPGHPEIETALVELYRHTGNRDYLDLARLFVERRGHGWLDTRVTDSPYFQDHKPVRENTSITGHAVRALYLAAGATDVAVETGDRELLSTMEALWTDMVSTKLYLTGGVGARHSGEAFGEPYELPPDQAYCESCAAIASVMWSWRLLLATGSAKYADLIERTLYNGVAASTSIDGTGFYYVNPLQAAAGGERRRTWYGCACCPPNIARLFASLQHYVATTDDTGIQLQQYAAGRIASGDVELSVATDYPWDGRIVLTVDRTPGAPWTLALRIPEWCATAVLTVNDASADISHNRGGYAVVEREWDAGDQVVLDLPMTPRVIHPHPRIEAIRGCVALERGPLVYCLEGIDNGSDLDDLLLDPAGPITAHPKPDLLGGTVSLDAAGQRRNTSDWGTTLYRPSPPQNEDRTAVTLTAIPYFQWANRGDSAMRVWVPQC